MSTPKTIAEIVSHLDEKRTKISHAEDESFRTKVSEALSNMFEQGFSEGEKAADARREKVSAFKGKVTAHAAFRTFAYADEHIQNGMCWGCGKVPSAAGILCPTCTKEHS